MPNTDARTLQPIELSIDRGKIASYAELTRDWNPIHLDEDFASGTPMGGIIAHGTLSLNLLWQSLAATLGPLTLHRLTLAVRFVKPVRPGDRLCAGGEWSAGAGCWEVWVDSDAGQRVISGTATLE